MIGRFGLLIGLTICILGCAKRDDYVDRFCEDLARTKFQGKWGFIDKSQNLVIPHSLVRSFSGGLAAVRVGKKWGYIDHTGKLVIPPQFDDAKRFEGRFAVVSKRESGFGSTKRVGLLLSLRSICSLERDL